MSNSSTKTVLIVGAGAVGCFYGSRLHNPSSNVKVSLVCRSNYKAIAQNGVTLKTHSFGDYHFAPTNVYPSISAASSGGPWDYVVVTTKALPDVTDDSVDIESLVSTAASSRSSIVLIQNGVGVEAPHRARFPHNPVLSAVTVVSAEQTSHGVIRQNRWTRVSVGPYTDGVGDATKDTDLAKESERSLDEFVSMLTAGGIKDAEKYDEKDLQLVRWHKLCINASMNPSAVLSGGAGNARMALDTELRTHLKACMDEVFAAAPTILGRPFPDKLARPDKILTSTERNKGAKPSMLLDWEAGRPMELEVIIGNPVRIARKAGVDMPRLQTLYALLKMAQTRRDEEKKAAEAAKSKL